MRADWSGLVLRIGVAFAFLYPPVAALGDPVSWFAYFPAFIRALAVPQEALLHGFGLLEAVIAAWILSGRSIFVPSVLATLILLAIVATNLPNLDVVFRDLSIACMSAALALRAHGKSTSPALA